MTLVEASQILYSFDKRLQNYAEKKMKQRENFNLVQSSVIGTIFFSFNKDLMYITKFIIHEAKLHNIRYRDFMTKLKC